MEPGVARTAVTRPDLLVAWVGWEPQGLDLRGWDQGPEPRCDRQSRMV
jgi:hypothetical protein